MQNQILFKISKFIQTKRIILAIVFAVLIVGVSVYGILKKDSLFITKVDNSKKLMTLQGTIEMDSDGDGLLDWEEALWGTDPHKFDTDGNGISDGEEIGERKKLLGVNIPNDENLNETDRFSREFFATIMSLSQQGLLNETSLSNLSNTLSNQIVNGDYPDAYTKADVSINPSSDAVIAYADDLAILFGNMDKTTNIGTEFVLVSELLNNKISRRDDLFKLSQKYKTFSEDAINVSAPSSLKNLHLQLANNLNNLSISVEQLSEIGDNPILGLKGVGGYTKFSDEFVKITTKIRDTII